MVLACEKDLTDTVSVERIIDQWKVLPNLKSVSWYTKLRTPIARIVFKVVINILIIFSIYAVYHCTYILIKSIILK